MLRGTFADWPHLRSRNPRTRIFIISIITDIYNEEHIAVLSNKSPFTDDRQRAKRGQLFLKGPVTFNWINQNIPDPASRLVLVARAFMDMENVSVIALSRKVWSAANIEGKDARHRVVQKIAEHANGYEIIPRCGRTSLLQKR